MTTVARGSAAPLALARTFAVAGAVLALSTAVVGRIAPTAGEGRPLRWLRVLVDHPLRGTLALGCLGAALTAGVGGGNRAAGPIEPAIRSLGRGSASEELD